MGVTLRQFTRRLRRGGRGECLADDSDLFDVLRRADPAARQRMPDATHPDAQHLLTRILQTPRTAAPAKRHPRRRWLVVIGLVTVGVTTAATWVVIHRSSVSDSLNVACYGGLSLGSDIVVEPFDLESPLEACRRVWKTGDLRNPKITPAGSVPPMTGCVLASGLLGIFPTDDVGLCDRLGLDAARLELSPVHAAVTRLQDQLAERFLGACVPVDHAAPGVKGLLTELGLHDWTVRITQPASPERPCASVAVDPKERAVSIVPVPDVTPVGAGSVTSSR